MAIVAIVAFVCGALFGGAASVLGILAYGMLHARRSSRRAEVSVAGLTPQYKAPPAGAAEAFRGTALAAPLEAHNRCVGLRAAT
jgi:hypothetical protein